MPTSEEQGLKVTQVYPARGWERQTIEAFDDRVVIQRKNIFQEWRCEYDYSELKSKVIEGKSGDPTWSTIAWYSIAFAAIIPMVGNIVFQKLIPPIIYAIVSPAFLVVAIISVYFRFIKHDQVWFYEKDNSVAFGITLYADDREEREQVVDYIIDKIEKAEALESLRKLKS